jgi:hypothetical protein
MDLPGLKEATMLPMGYKDIDITEFRPMQPRKKKPPA